MGINNNKTHKRRFVMNENGVKTQLPDGQPGAPNAINS